MPEQTVGVETKGKTQEKMERRCRKGSSGAGSEMERVGDRQKNGRILFDRPKPTAGCSANGGGGRR